MQNPRGCGIMMGMEVVISKSEEETLRIAEGYAATLARGDVVLVEGEMGAGKTVFAKGVARGLGIREEVSSPTYTYVNEYGDPPLLFHFDCYRVTSEDMAYALGLADYFDRDGICLIEWSQNIRGLLPANCKRVKIAAHAGAREISL